MTTASERPALDAVLEYRHGALVASFQSRFGVSRGTATTIFEDMLRFLWLAREHRGDQPRVAIYRAIGIVDEMWHSFILYTRDYAVFCSRYFGEFLHHSPAEQGRRRAHARADDYPRFVELVWNELGSKVANRWFDVYPREFPPKRIHRLLLAHA